MVRAGRRGRRSWQQLSWSEKRRLRFPGPPVLFRCRLCRTQVTTRDRQGHIDRYHPGADMLVLFRVYKP